MQKYEGKTRSIRRLRWLQQAGQAPDRNYFVGMILSIVQDIWAIVRGLGGGDMKGISLGMIWVAVLPEQAVEWGIIAKGYIFNSLAIEIRTGHLHRYK
jgi:hypothetical protein